MDEDESASIQEQYGKSDQKELSPHLKKVQNGQDDPEKIKDILPLLESDLEIKKQDLELDTASKQLFITTILKTTTYN